MEGRPDTVPEALLRRIAEKRIFFGHQSVGRDILEGVRQIGSSGPGVRLRIVESADPAVLNRPGFAHARIGRNRDPASKCDAFAAILKRSLGERADIAFFKFCYVDFPPGAEVAALARRYRDTLRAMRSRFPGTRFLPVTAPLTCPERTGIFGRLAGRLPGRGDANPERARFNERLREEFGGEGSLFDLALAESTAPDGTRAVSPRDGTVPILYPGYTDDGGHLNGPGRAAVARRLLLLLAEGG